MTSEKPESQKRARHVSSHPPLTGTLAHMLSISSVSLGTWELIFDQRDMPDPPCPDPRLSVQHHLLLFSPGFIYLSRTLLIIFSCTLLICSFSVFVCDSFSAFPHPCSTCLVFQDSTAALPVLGNLPYLRLSTHSQHGKFTPEVSSSMMPTTLHYTLAFVSPFPLT